MQATIHILHVDIPFNTSVKKRGSINLVRREIPRRAVNPYKGLYDGIKILRVQIGGKLA